MRKAVLENLVTSLVGCVGISFLGFIALAVWQSAGNYSNVVPFRRLSTPLWAEAILWLHILISIVLFFFLGTKLKLLGKQWLSFLSGCGMLVVGAIIFIASLFYSWFLFLLIFPQVTFLRLVILIDRVAANSFYAVILIVLILPSVIIWLGMLYQSKKNKRREAIVAEDTTKDEIAGSEEPVDESNELE